MDRINKKVIDLLNNNKYLYSRFLTDIDPNVINSYDNINYSDIIEFISFSLDFLEIKNDNSSVVYIELSNEKKWDMKSFACYIPSNKTIFVNCNGRHIMDVFRSLAHELVHYRQDLIGVLEDNKQVNDNNDGVPIENEANSLAAVIMRKYGRKRPELFG